MGTIYCVTNIENGKKYIGSTKNFKIRKRQHLTLLRKGQHHSRYLQHAFDAYGEDAFDWGVLEQCKNSELIVREQYYYSLIEPEYNMVEPAEGGPSSLRRPVLQVDPATGEIIETFISVMAAAEYMNVSRAAISAVARGENYTSAGYRWVYPEDYDSMEEIPSTEGVRVCMLDRRGNVVDEFMSLSEAARVVGNSHAAISQAVSSGGTSAGHYWCYPEDVSNAQEYIMSQPEQPTYTLIDTETDETFTSSSIKELARLTGLSRNSVRALIRGNTGSVSGFILHP